jgi:hypothetical protein
MRVASYLKSTVSQRRHRRRKAVADFKQKQSHERPFADRFDAGRQLATKLLAYATCPNLLVLALPRGGVPVAYEVARALHAPLDIFIVRKLGVPWNEELAMGAIATGRVRVLNPEAISCSDLPESIIDEVAKREQKELESRSSMRSQSESKKSWNVAKMSTEAIVQPSTYTVARSFWWMTDWQRENIDTQKEISTG